MKKEGFSVDQAISQCAFSNLFKSGLRFKLLFITNNEKHKIVMLDSQSKKQKQVNLDLKLNKTLGGEHINEILFYDIDYNNTNEIIITTDNGRIIVINLNFDEKQPLSTFNSYNVNIYDVFSMFAQKIQRKTNSKDKITELFQGEKIKLSPKINSILFPNIITRKIITIAMDKYLINLDMNDFSIQNYSDLGSQITHINQINHNISIVTTQNAYVLAIEQLLSNKLDLKTALTINDTNITKISKIYNDLLIIKENSVKRLTIKNKSKWAYNVEGSISADILNYDYDYDGYDELLIVSKSGIIHALDKDGKVKWLYNTEFWNTNMPLFFSHKGLTKKQLVSVVTFDGKIYLFKPKGILDLNVEPSSAVMLDYGFYDLEYDANQYLTGNLIEKIEINDTILDNFKLDNEYLLLVSPKGNIYLINVFEN